MRALRPGVVVLALAAAWWLFAGLAAVWGPSLITVLGQAAATPPASMGLFALGCVLAVLGVVALTRGRAAVVVLGVALVARVVLAFQPGGQGQLWAATVGVVAALAWLAHLAGRHGRLLAAGLAAGWLLQATAGAVTGTWWPVWRTDPFGLGLLVVLGVLALATAPAGLSRSGPASRRQAWSLLPLALVAGVAVVNPGRASAVDPGWGPLMLVLGCALAVLVALLAGRRPGSRGADLAVRAGLGVVALLAVAASLYGTATVDGVSGVLSPWTLVAFLLGPAGLVAVLLPVGGTSAGPGGAVLGSSLAVGGGGVVWVLLFFAYYAGYDLGYRADAVLLAALAVLVVAAVTGAYRRRRGPAGEPGTAYEEARSPRPVSSPLPAVVGVVALVVVAAVGAVLQRPPTATAAPDGDGLRVLAWNLRMGYGTHGRFDPGEVASVVGDADVVLLSEVDRGWLLNGGQDELAILARLTGMRAYFVPAADPVWGDAILTRLPVSEVRGRQLPSYGAVTGAGVLSARVSTAVGPVWAMSTHVQPTTTRTDATIDQARDLAALAEDRGEDGTPVVLGGDFNLEPGTDSFATLTGTSLVDALAAERPVPTFDADDPETQIDHVFVDGPWQVTGAGTVDTRASDHLPVWVELRPRR